jgi:uncharacterized membrane protein YgcG
MKTRLIICVLLVGLGATAQNYSPLIEDDKTWSCYGDYFFINVKYRIQNDTLIEQKTYRKVMACADSMPFSFDWNAAVYKSAIREENGKVWVVEKGQAQERLLYDFSKNAGDTILYYRPIGNVNQGVLPNYQIGKIYKVNTINIGGVVRKRMYIHAQTTVDQSPPQAYNQLDSQADIWIEGIGAITGLFSRMPMWGVVGPQPYLLICVEKQGNIIYQPAPTGYNFHPSDGCFIIQPNSGNNGGGGTGGGGTNGGGTGGGTGGGGSGGNDTNALAVKPVKWNIQVYPNPTERFLVIDAPFLPIYKYSICNQQGVVVQTGDLNEKSTIDMQLRRPGFYLLSIQTQRGNQYFRIVKRE